MYIEVISKILSESLLSLYPIFVKYINISFGLQIWSRFITYFLISSFFIDWTFIFKNILTRSAILLSIVTIIHVYVSYRGFQLLESGISYIIFYTYPLMILLFAKEKISYLYIFAIIGIILLANSGEDNKNESYENKENKENKVNNNIFSKKNIKEQFPYEGVVMMILAALTEAIIYFLVRDIKTLNNWNHLFISYGLGTIILSIYFSRDLIQQKYSESESGTNKTLYISLIINAIIGLFGYLLRFYAVSRLETKTYSALSYIGILMAYIYGVIINKDSITMQKIIGSILILIPNIKLLKN
jgi:drug/metabolite transporter (DMT)-like permease